MYKYKEHKIKETPYIILKSENGTYGMGVIKIESPDQITSLNRKNRNKLFNYLIQAYETESNIKTIIEIKQYLLQKKTKLVLYGYDSFLFDFSKDDGVSTLTELKNILERNGHMVKSKAGSNYGEMNDISDRL
mgnify:CR=1 FL=1